MYLVRAFRAYQMQGILPAFASEGFGAQNPTLLYAFERLAAAEAKARKEIEESAG
jgi:hypothetical protein